MANYMNALDYYPEGFKPFVEGRPQEQKKFAEQLDRRPAARLVARTTPVEGTSSDELFNMTGIPAVGAYSHGKVYLDNNLKKDFTFYTGAPPGGATKLQKHTISNPAATTALHELEHAAQERFPEWLINGTENPRRAAELAASRGDRMYGGENSYPGQFNSNRDMASADVYRARLDDLALREMNATGQPAYVANVFGKRQNVPNNVLPNSSIQRDIKEAEAKNPAMTTDLQSGGFSPYLPGIYKKRYLSPFANY